MRISGGSAKGRNVGIRKAFAARKGEDDLRPTSAKVRKAIFDILGQRIIDARFLDLYAGTGAVGIEALSRGAASAFFIESNATRAALIRDSIERFGFKDRAHSIKDHADHFLSSQKNRTTRQAAGLFDIIFIDPPYASEEWERILALINKTEVLAQDGIVLVEHPSKRILPPQVGILERAKTYKYGDTSISLYKKELKS